MSQGGASAPQSFDFLKIRANSLKILEKFLKIQAKYLKI